MELQQFVTEALRQIIAGVAEAQKGVESSGGEVSPRYNPNQKDWAGYVEVDGAFQPVFRVGFDVAVSVTEGSEKRAGIGVASGFFSLGGGGSANQTTGTVSRLTFEVPVLYPLGRKRK